MIKTIISAGLSRLETGTRIVIADNIRDLGQEDWSAVMPHRHPRTNDFT